MVIKITGDVASVQAAITTGAQFAEQRNGLVAHKVIARPGEGILLAETPSPSVIEPEPEASEIADVVLKRQPKRPRRNQNWSAAICVWIQNVRARRANLVRFAFILASEVKRNG